MDGQSFINGPSEVLDCAWSCEKASVTGEVPLCLQSVSRLYLERILKEMRHQGFILSPGSIWQEPLRDNDSENPEKATIFVVVRILEETWSLCVLVLRMHLSSILWGSLRGEASPRCVWPADLIIV